MYRNIFDTHAHYAANAFENDRQALLERLLPDAGIAYIMLAGVYFEDCRKSASLARQYDYIYCSAGLHPSYIANLPSDWEQQIRNLAAYEKCKAIGEIGLDYHEHPETKDLQKEIFIRQLEIAGELHLPVLLHICNAMGDAVEILKTYQPKGVMHCYNGSTETTKELLKIPELYFSFSGILTYENAKKPLKALQIIPPDRILIETDAPYLAPVPHRHMRCDSRMMIHTAQKAAAVKNIPLQEFLTICCENAKRLFGISAEN